MLPEQTLSVLPMFGEYLFPDSLVPASTELDFELGGADIQDTSQGLQVKTWAAFIQGNDIWLAAEGRAPESWITRPGLLTEVSLAFDQNMRPAIAFVEDGIAWLYWYNTVTEDFEYTSFPDAQTPRVCLDDKRAMQTGTSDIILAYIKNNNLYFRAQRDRFTVEYLLRTEVNATLEKIGMADNLRVLFKLIPVT